MENQETQENQDLNPAKPDKTPLEKVREQQAEQQNTEVQEERVDTTAEVPGQSIPSEIRHHPQRTRF